MPQNPTTPQKIKLRHQGFSFEKIAEVLNTMKILTKTGRGKWHRKTVQAILKRHEDDWALASLNAAFNTYLQ